MKYFDRLFINNFIQFETIPTREASNYMGNAETESATRSNGNICLPIFQETYNADIIDPIDFRKCIDQNIALFPKLFLEKHI
jgi:hypothetical protein